MILRKHYKATAMFIFKPFSCERKMSTKSLHPSLQPSFRWVRKQPALAAMLVALSFPVTADEVPSAPAAPNTRNAVTEVAPVLTLEDMKNTYAEEPRVDTIVNGPGESLLMSTTVSSDGRYMIVNIKPEEFVPGPGDTVVIVAQIPGVDANGNPTYSFHRAVPDEASFNSTLVTKFEPISLTPSREYAFTRSATFVLPKAGVWQNTAGSKLLAGIARGGDILAMVQAGKYGEIHSAASSETSIPPAADVPDLMLPGAEALSSPIVIPAIPGLTFPQNIVAYGGARLQVNGGEWATAAMVNVADTVVVKGAASTLSDITKEFGFMAEGGRKIKMELYTQKMTTINLNTNPNAISSDPNNSTMIDSAVKFIVDGATLSRKTADGVVTSRPYVSGELIQPLDSGYLNLRITFDKGIRYCNVLPQLYSKPVNVSIRSGENFIMNTHGSGSYRMFNSVEDLRAAVGIGTDGLLSLGGGSAKAELVSLRDGVSTWKLLNATPGKIVYTGNFNHHPGLRYNAYNQGLYKFKWNIDVQP